MRRAIRGFTVLLSVVSVIILAISFVSAGNLPDKFWVVEGETLVLKRELPISIQYVNAGQDTNTRQVSAVGTNYSVNLKVLGIFPVKQARVEVVKQRMVVPCGTAFGIKMYTEGVVVVGTASIDSDNGTKNPSAEAQIKEGDILLRINGKEVSSNEDVAKIIEESGGTPLSIKGKRKDKPFEATLTPVKSRSDGQYKAGLWVRDSSAGIGTLTFYEPGSGAFAGLGHGICDVDTGELLPLESGEIVPVAITGIVKGADGAPGELKGYFKAELSMGRITLNNETGVFGQMSSQPAKGEALPVAMKQQVKAGSAQIITTLGDKAETYDIEIEKVNYNMATPTRNMVIKITDARLLEKTGGIIQGMSGSPILQNGMVVGAVTHVFVNDSEKGYGIFAENMLASMQQ